MGYSKKKFEGKYANWYNIIKSSGNTSVQEAPEYSKVANEINELQWEGKSKDSICQTVTSIDDTCSGAYRNYVATIIAKTKVVYGVFFNDLDLLKTTIDLYNNCVDDYDRISNALAAALAEAEGIVGN